MESQVELNKERVKLLDEFKKIFSELMVPESAKWEVAYREGVLSSKVKRLIALGIALRAGCTNCILGQTMRALEAGATKDEILETVSVQLVMSGTTGIAESLRVIKLLDELGKL